MNYPFNYLGKAIDINKEEFLALKTYYDCELNYLDFKLGQLLKFLKKINEYE